MTKTVKYNCSKHGVVDARVQPYFCKSRNENRVNTICPECVRINSRNSYQKNKEKISIKHAEYRAKNIDKMKEKNKKWVKANPDKAKAYVKKWSHNNRLYFREYDKRYRIEHPEIVAAKKNRRRALQINAEINDLTGEQWSVVLSSFNNKCAYCGSSDRITQDHVIPFARGGNHTKSNVVPACKSCNSIKSSRLLEEIGWEVQLCPAR